jgi:hypothetical protein
LHRKISRLLALEDAVHIPRRSPVLAKKIGAVGDHAAGGDEVAIGTPRPTQLARRAGGEGPLPRDPLAVDGVEVAGIRTLIAVPMLRRMRRSAPSLASICRTTCSRSGPTSSRRSSSSRTTSMKSLVLSDRIGVMRSRPGRVFAKSRPLCRARATANPPLSISSNAGCARAHQHHRRPRKPARARMPRSGGERRGAGLAGVIHIFIPIA